MGHIAETRAYDAPASLVWDVITDPALYADVAPNLRAVDIVEGEAVGMVRQCVDTDGNEWRETCTTWEPERTFAVAVDVPESPFHRRLFTRFEGRWDLDPRPDGVLVTVSFEFDTRYGPLGWLIGAYFRRVAPAMLADIFDGWERAIQDRRSDRGGTADSR